MAIAANLIFTSLGRRRRGSVHSRPSEEEEVRLQLHWDLEVT